MDITETEDRLKIVFPIRRNWLLLTIYSTAFLAWVMMLILVVAFIVRGQALGIVHGLLLVIWTIIWLWFGRIIWKRWQYSVASREILFIDADSLILRRPVSIFGPTSVYDREFVGPFYFSERHKCPAFDYAFLHVYFAQSLDEHLAKEIVSELNGRLFPEVMEELDQAHSI